MSLRRRCTVGGGGSSLTISGSACADCSNRATDSFTTVAGGFGNAARDMYDGGGGFRIPPAAPMAPSAGNDNVAAGTPAPSRRRNNSSLIPAARPGRSVQCAGGIRWPRDRSPDRPAVATVTALLAPADTDGDQGPSVGTDPIELRLDRPNQFLMRANGGVASTPRPSPMAPARSIPN